MTNFFSGKITSSYSFKAFLLIIITLLLLIPLSMIQGLVDERRERAGEVETSIMDSWGDQLFICGPIISIPFTEREEVRTKTEKGGETVEIHESKYFLRIVPESLNIKAVFETEEKKRGIFSVPLFTGDVQISGNFDFTEALADIKPNQRIFPEQAEIIISLSSQKGIRKVNNAKWNEKVFDFKPGSKNFSLMPIKITSENQFSMANNGGMHSGAAINRSVKNSFDINISIQGGKSVNIIPLGKDTAVSIAADWNSPSFQGSYLPVKKNITDKGFDAYWEISYLSKDIPLFWIDNGAKGKTDFYDSRFGVYFFKALDHYALNTRAVKYGILFLIIPFLTLFLLEVFIKRNIHPVQYLLAGLGNVIFYLLLLSISEHLPFNVSYIIGAISVTAMMLLYSRSLIKAWNKSLYMGLVMAASYIFLYSTLKAEDWALLIGSVGAFAITGIVMFLTKNLDWSNSSKSVKNTDER